MSAAENRLAKESSPYLKLHAKNPVDWYPWGQEALEKASASDKPILLSIGYAACHWCHVMAQESFEDPETADLMNRYFINIKVDREERPDLDKIYQTTLQLITSKAGGWPLTMFLTPDDQIPYYGGTYFPKRAGFGMLSFKEVLQKIALYYKEHHQEIQTLKAGIQNAFQQLEKQQQKKDATLEKNPIEKANQQLLETFDKTHGGFGGAPKFPQSNYIERMLRMGGDGQSVATITLEKMAKGGVYDQLGAGFFRYAVDEAWMIPHFEKMLYDNAGLLPLYADAYIVTGKPLFKDIAIATANWVMREMQSEAGGYYATIGADSEGVEGKFYYWDRDEIKNLLTDQEYDVALSYFNLNSPSNFEGYWHLHVINNVDGVDAHFLESLKLKLFNHRSKRVFPLKDEKILTAWNGLMIKAMVDVGKYLDRPEFIDSAERALEFVINQLWQDKRLLAVYKDGKAYLKSYLDDYAFLLEAIIHYLQVRWSARYLELAISLVDTLCQYYYDEKHGGFYFTADDHEPLIQRPKLLMDEATPSANGVLAYCFLRLGYMIGEQNYLDIAEDTLKAAWESIVIVPIANHSLLLALQEYFTPPTLIILRGDEAEMQKWQRVFNQHYRPSHLCFAIPNTADHLPEALDKPKPKQGVIAYICEGKVCHKTIHALEEFKALFH